MQVVPSEHQQAILCCASDGPLAQLPKRGYGISSLEVSKSPPLKRHDLVQPAPSGHTWAGRWTRWASEVPYNFNIQWICNSVTSTVEESQTSRTVLQCCLILSNPLPQFEVNPFSNKNLQASLSSSLQGPFSLRYGTEICGCKWDKSIWKTLSYTGCLLPH